MARLPAPAPGTDRRLAPAIGVADVPHPFPYQGSKRGLAPVVLRFLPDDTARLIENFAGSAALSLAARFTARAQASVLNDVNAPLMALWRRILDEPAGLAGAYAGLWHAARPDPKAFFVNARAEFNRTRDPALLLYLLNRIVKGAVRYSRDGTFNQSADHRRLGAHPDTVLRRVTGTARTLAGAELHSAGYESLLLDADRRDVVYLDPPYQGVTNVADSRYLAGLNRADFERVLGQANDNGVSYLVSYDAVREDNRYGEALSAELGLAHLHLAAGRSAQATLHGRHDVTIESLYLSPALVSRLGGQWPRLARLGYERGQPAPGRAR